MDLIVIAETEMSHRFVGGDIASGRDDLTDLGPGVRFDRDFGSNTLGVTDSSLQLNDDTIGISTVVSIDTHRFIQVIDNQIEVTVPVNVHRCRTITHSKMVQSPVFSPVFEFELPVVLVKNIALFQRRQRHEQLRRFFGFPVRP